MENRCVKEVEVVEKIKEVPVAVPNDDLKEEIGYWKNKYEEICPRMQRLKIEKEGVDE